MTTASDPSRIAYAVTPSDTVDLPYGRTRGIYVGVAGNVVAVMDSGAVTFIGVAAGTVLPIRTTRINATSTTATNIVALY